MSDNRFPAAEHYRPAALRSPLLPGIASGVLLLAATLFAASAIAGGEATQGMWVMCAFFLLPGIGLGRAALLSRNNANTPEKVPGQEPEKRTVTGLYPIMVSLTSVYCWILLIGLQVFTAINGQTPDNIKWYVTLGIALAASVFMRFHGNTVLQRQFAGTAPGAVTLTATQSLGVVLFVVAAGLYFSWLMFW